MIQFLPMQTLRAHIGVDSILCIIQLFLGNDVINEVDYGFNRYYVCLFYPVGATGQLFNYFNFLGYQLF